MKSILALGLVFSFLSHTPVLGQIPKTINPNFSKKISSMIDFSIPIVMVQDLAKRDNITILDAREKKEFNISHIPKALYIGYKHIDKTILSDMDKNKPIVVYCSIGYRSEKIGKKLKNMGFTKVYNLYGSIFEWVNNGYALEDEDGKPTNKIHSYNKSWGKWIENDKYEKVY